MKSNRKAGSAGRRERRTFTDEFKAEAVRLVAERRALGMTLAQVGRELDVRPDQLRRWTRGQRHEIGARSSVPGETLEQGIRSRPPIAPLGAPVPMLHPSRPSASWSGCG